jgi:hypothetical protein
MIILLSGWAGSGKDAAALLLEEMNFIRLAFADGLKAEVAAATGIPLDTFHDHRLKDTLLPGGKTPRQLLIEHAATIRATDPDVYTRRVMSNINLLHNYVISDWRYPREEELLTTAFGQNVMRIRINRSIVQMDDPTEHALDDATFDRVIQNDGSISELRDTLRAIVHWGAYPADWRN